MRQKQSSSTKELTAQELVNSCITVSQAEACKILGVSLAYFRILKTADDFPKPAYGTRKIKYITEDLINWLKNKDKQLVTYEKKVN